MATADHQRISTAILDLQIALGYLRQVQDDTTCRIAAAEAQLQKLTDEVGRKIGFPSSDEELS